jgi:cytochrome d ubiquinol oxidase subunit II
MTTLILLFLGISILFYCLFAGADFGAGIVEMFSPRKNRKDIEHVTTKAIGPVWEANHVWLILAIVILFNGFPRVYHRISIVFHIPMTLILIGIVLRGCAFTFRHYDAIRDGSERIYARVFRYSSLMTTFFLGVLAAGAIRDSISRRGALDSDFLSLYIYSWFNWFGLSLGVFTCCLFSFLASIYLIGETTEPWLQKFFTQRAKTANMLMVLVGGFVFLGAQVSGVSLFTRFIHDPFTLICLLVATALLIPLWFSFTGVLFLRVCAAAQVALVLLGWFRLQSLEGISWIYEAAAPESTQRALLIALLVGSAIIFPALFYLFRVFKFRVDTQ